VGLQLEITAATVPEPSTLFSALGLVGFALARCYLRRKLKIKIA
jgi:hypothetical protein